jgi:hypothetical protein
MKKIALLVSVVFVLICNQIFAQSDSTKISTDINIEITSIQFDLSSQLIKGFLDSNKVYIETQNEYKTHLSVSFILNEMQYETFEKLLPQLGYITTKEVNSVNNNKKSEEIEFEIKYLKSQKASYEVILAKINENSDQYFSTWKELKAIEERIFDAEQKLAQFETSYNTYSIELKIDDEIGSPGSSRVSFVNMPGVEYSFLNIEAPLSGISTDNYQGYFLKYLFTKGKSYANIGAYKALDGPIADTSYFSEMFLLGFGQDFYSRYMGRGSKKFLNLYSSYTIGGLLASGTTTKDYMFYIMPAIGIELFKNKYILLDTKVSYFVPITEYNPNMRGLSFNTSFNFVF